MALEYIAGIDRNGATTEITNNVTVLGGMNSAALTSVVERPDALAGQEPVDFTQIPNDALDARFDAFCRDRRIVQDGEGGWMVKEPIGNYGKAGDDMTWHDVVRPVGRAMAESFRNLGRTVTDMALNTVREVKLMVDERRQNATKQAFADFVTRRTIQYRDHHQNAATFIAPMLAR